MNVIIVSERRNYKIRMILLILIGMFISLIDSPNFVFGASKTTKPGRPKISVTLDSDKSSLVISIKNTANADGYAIYARIPGKKKFSKVSTIACDDDEENTNYTYSGIIKGKYTFRVKAYKVDGKKKIWGKYSRFVKITVKDKNISKTSTEIINNILNAKCHEIVTLGRYEQDNNLTNGKEPLEWIVLSNNGTEVLLLCRYGIDQRPYNEEYEEVTWEDCDIRNWLNNDFYNSAFNNTEKDVIKAVTIVNPNNSYYGTEGGRDTEDKVFLLTMNDLTNIDYGFSDDQWAYDIERRCTPTDYAKAQGVNTALDFFATGTPSDDYKTKEGVYACAWWLRSVGADKHNFDMVEHNGHISLGGGRVDWTHNAVRPSLYISLK